MNKELLEELNSLREDLEDKAFRLSKEIAALEAERRAYESISNNLETRMFYLEQQIARKEPANDP